MLIDRAEVVREVILSQEIDEQCACHGRIHNRDRLPSLSLSKVSTPTPRHELMGKPFTGASEMPFE
jgi:hypothetical protein